MTPLPADLAASLGAFALKSLALFGLAGVALLALRRASAASRHLVCLLTLLALLLLPALSASLPGWAVPALSLPREPTPSHKFATPPETEGGRGVEASATLGRSSSSSRFGRTPVTEERGNKEVGSSPRPFPWPLVLLTCWLAGVFVASLRPALGLWGIGRLRRDCRPVTDAPILALSEECASALHLKRLPALWQADVPVPMTWAWRRPIVLLPLTAETWPADRLQAVLLHEQAHVRRGDWLWHRLADLICALYWFHPFAWATARRLRAEGEMACDDLVLSSGVAAPDYARHLLDVARGLQSAPILPQAALAMARTLKIERRLKMILNTTRSHGVLTRRALFFVLLPAVVVLVMLAALRLSAKAPASADAAQPQLVGGILVNLAGVTDGTIPGHHWWTADGTPLQHPLYQSKPEDFLWATGSHFYCAEQRFLTPATGGRAYRSLIFAFRLPPAAKDVTTEWELPNSLHSSSQGTWLTKGVSEDTYTEAQISRDTGGVRTVSALYPLSVSQADVKVKVATGPWTTVATQRVRDDWFGTTKETPAGSFIFSRITDVNPGRTAVTITTDSPKQDVRVVAADDEGREILPTGEGEQSTNTLDQMSLVFESPSADGIAEIRVQTRPFYETEFKNIALQPAPTPEVGTRGTKP